MGELRGGKRFLLEPAQPFAVARKCRRQDLDGDVPVQPGIVRAINAAHASLAYEVGQLEGSHPGAWGNRHQREMVTASRF